MSYADELEAWKWKHGLPPGEVNQDELRMIAEDKASTATSWCFGCDAEMPVKDMQIVTRAIDPYVQFDEGGTDYIAEEYRVRMCSKCFATYNDA